jgi:capsular polysaccharide transport system ATP-binding protein
MIELRHVSKAYKTPAGLNHVLSDLSVQFPPNENVGVLGRNGAGKSTLLRIISGVEQPDHGNIYRQGRISWPIGFSGGFNGSLSGEENCRFVARIYGEDVDRVVGFAHEFSEIGNYFFMPVRTYSSGMKARLAFGVSMAIDFNFYLVDEVTAVGDKQFQKKCREAFDERQERSSVIMVSHNMNTIEQYCHKCAVLKNGVLQL